MTNKEKTPHILPSDVWSGDKRKPIICMEPVAIGTEDAARALGVSRPTVYSLLNRDDFPSFRIGNRVLVDVAGLRKWVSQQANTENNQI